MIIMTVSQTESRDSVLRSVLALRGAVFRVGKLLGLQRGVLEMPVRSSRTLLLWVSSCTLFSHFNNIERTTYAT